MNVRRGTLPQADPGPDGLASAVQEAFEDAAGEHGDGYIHLVRDSDGAIRCEHLDPDIVVLTREPRVKSVPSPRRA